MRYEDTPEYEIRTELGKARDAERQCDGWHITMAYRIGVALVLALLNIAAAIRERS